jgi:hypothetical protein
MMLILLGMALVGPALADDDDRRLFLVPAGRRPLQQFLRPLIGRPLLGGAGRPLLGGAGRPLITGEI